MSWRTRARYHIRRVLNEHESKGLTGDQMLAIVRDSYPFGERRMHPYKVWLREVKELERTLAGDKPVTSVIMRECPACGSKPGEPCREYAKRWEFGTHWPTLPAGEFHEARERGVHRDLIAEERAE